MRMGPSRTPHLVYRQGIPNRLVRRVPVSSAVVINAADDEPDSAMGDFLLFNPHAELPPSGQLGILLDTNQKGIRVVGFTDKSPAQRAGLMEGDRIGAIAGTLVNTYSDIRYALLDHGVNEQIQVEVIRTHLIRGDEHISYIVTLD